jgi:iron-sulfur cluster assembly accessory protein
MMEALKTHGSELVVTPAAADQVRALLAKDPTNASKTLRLYVEDGGCSGMRYGMVFDEARPEDRFVEGHGVTVLVDPVSLDYLRGAELDYLDELNESGFKIRNPNARQSCGCGKSFEV